MIWETLFWVSALLVVYVYAAYPLLLLLLSRMGVRRPVRADDNHEPSVTLVISVFNEISVIKEKLENSLAISYPRDKLQILVVSDASDDGTDECVREFESEGVVLHRMDERGGKTLGLNAALERASGDIVVFSDANAMYRENTIASLARNFADADVGAVIGESTYVAADADADRSESAYWRYEIALKRLETDLGSVVGGDGAIYAIRRHLYRAMPADALSDFVNPLQIVEQGFRCIYEPAAVSEENAAGSFGKEFKRKVRIVNRAWRAMLRMRALLNPIRFGRFALQFLTHKVLRWLVPFAMLIAFATNAILALNSGFYAVLFGIQCAFYVLAGLGALMSKGSGTSALFYVPYYFCLVNLASAKGIFEAYQGKTYTTWSTARADG